MLARDPWLADYDVRTAVVLGEADRVRQLLGHDAALATRTDERTGWTALHLACASRWHQLDPARPSCRPAIPNRLTPRWLPCYAPAGLPDTGSGRPADRRDVKVCRLWPARCDIHLRERSCGK
jgi:hypothetical protein